MSTKVNVCQSPRGPAVDSGLQSCAETQCCVPRSLHSHALVDEGSHAVSFVHATKAQRSSLPHSASFVHLARAHPFSSISSPPQSTFLQYSSRLHVLSG